MSDQMLITNPIARKNYIISRMFVETAERNYIVARWAFFHECNIDFCWLSAHALEKYLKAILLFNGRSILNFKHDLEEPLREVLRLFPSIDIGILKPPPIASIFPKGDEAFSAFIHRIGRMGNPNNRYMQHGYVLHGDEVFKLDQVVWQLHRYCRPASRLDVSEKDYKPHGLLGKLLRSTRKGDKTLRVAFLKHNHAFAPSRARKPTRWSFNFTNSPLAPLLERLKDQKATLESRQIAYDVCKWLVENIFLGVDKKIILRAMAAFKPN